MILLVAMVLGAGALPDMPAPMGRLDGVFERRAGGVEQGEKIVDIKLPGCDHTVPLNVTLFVAGSLFAMQQMVEWMRQTEGLEASIFPPHAIDEVSAGVAQSLPADLKACKALPKDVVTAGKLCPGSAPDHAWLATAAGKPGALVRWGPSAGKNRCLPKITALMFDAGGAARVRFDADFGAAASGALLGDKCQVTLTLDPAKEVFHAVRRGCKG